MEKKYNGVCFQVKVTPESRRKPKTEDEDKDVLILAPFNKLPKLLFENVKVGTSKLQHIIVRNPNDSRIEIQLDRLPPEKCGLTFSVVKFDVEAHEDKWIEVIWTPSKVESLHHVIQVKNSHRLKLDISIACTSVDPQKAKKKNVKPLKVQNAHVNALLTSKKGGVKPLSYSKTEVSSGIKKSVNRSFRPTFSTVNKLKQEYNISSEQFATIKDNRLPPCSVPSTPTRRETYLVFQETGIGNKENAEFKHMQKRTKSANDICVPVDLRQKQFRTFEYSSSIQNVSPVLATPPRQRRCQFGEKNAELKFHTEMYCRSLHKSSLCTVGRKTYAKESNNDLSPDPNQNFFDRLNWLSFTPTPSRTNQAQQEVASNLQYSSPEGSLLPPCNILPTPDRRQTYAIPPGSKPENELQMQSSEETVFTSRRIRHVHTTCTSVPRIQLEYDEFNDSLEEQNDVFNKNVVTENGAEQWSQWQKHNFSRSEGSSEESGGKHCESVGKTPRSKIYSTGLTPQFDKLNFSSHNSISICPGSPVDFSLLPPTEDTRRCSTVMKKLEQVSYDSPCNTVCKDLFPTDLVEYVANDSMSGELSCLSSGTFVKSGSSFPDINFQYPDISCQEPVSQQNSYKLDKEINKPLVSLSPEQNSAKSVIEAGLWVKQSAEKLLDKTTVSSNVHVLNTISEESISIDSFSHKEQKTEESKEKLSAIPVKQFKKSENAESGGVFLEISPPRKQVYDLCGSTTDSVQKQKTSCITGWSKTSVKSRNYQCLNFTPGVSHKLNGTTSNLTGKKRPFNGIKINQNVSKRRILSDGSIHNTNIQRGVSAQRPLRRGSTSSIPLKVLTKLTLSMSKKQKEEAVQLHNPDAVLNKLANPGLFEATNTAEPFTTSSVYYDEEWMVQQEKEFTKWLNSLLTPPEELNSTTALPKVDVAELWIQSCRKQDVVPAPTREMVSSQYHTNHHLDALRKAACSLFRSQETAQVLSKVAVHVDKKLIAIRSDRDLHLDFGLKCQVMKLLLSYNPLWLRIGLEAVYGQTIPLESNSDVQGLTKFIGTRLLSDPYIVQQNSHPTVSHLFLPGFEDAMKKFTLKKFLLLVYFLDKAKEKKLISHDPCLFCKDAELKDSRQILLAFSRDLLSGIGDITKHLKSLGYIVTQRQTYLDEFEYAVNCLGKDLRDGIRLTRVMEIILQNRTLSNELRVPAVSRLQKIHNVDVALLALNGAGYVLTGNIMAKDISDGHREKTLSLLWQIIYKFQEPRFIDAAKKIQNWWRHQSLKLEIRHRIQARKLAHLTQAATRIQAYWRSYCARMQLEILIAEEAVKYAAQQKASIVIQKNWRMYFEHKKYTYVLNSVKKIQSWYRNIKMAKKERMQFLQRHQTLMSFQAVCRGYVYRRRLASLQRTAAALKIQTWYRRHIERKKIESLIPLIQKLIEKERLVSATVTIQKKFRATMLMRADRQHFLQLKSAAVVIQRRLQATLLIKKQAEWYQRQKSAASTIQKKFRATVLMRAQRQHYLQQKFASTVIQRRFRATLLMKKQVEWYQQQRSAASIIQNKFRATLMMKFERQQFLKQKFAAVVIQRKFKAMLIMKEQVQLYHQQRSAAIIIQNKFRATLLMRVQRQHFLQQKYAATNIQRKFRATLIMKKQVELYQKQRSAASIIQNKFRATMFMRSERQQFQKQKLAATVIQRRFRAILLMKNQMQKYHLQRYAAIIIQKKFRATLMMKFERQQFLKQKFSTTVIQKRFRAMLIMKKQMQWYKQQRSAIVFIQRKLRATIIMRCERQHFLKQKNAVILIQRLFRAKLLKKKHAQKCQLQIFAVRVIQNKFRATMLMRSERQHFLKQKFSATIIQRRFRATLLMKKQAEWYQQQRFVAIFIQNKFRATLLMRSERENFLKKKSAAITMQNKFRAKILGQKERSSFLRKKSAALVIQWWFRANLMKKGKERCTILKSRQEENRRKTAAAIKIQALWRGYRERKTGSQEMTAVRERALSTAQNALPGTTLQTRSTAALFILQKTCSGRLIWALMELDTITQLSPKLCVDIANSSVVKTIYKCLGNANRSEVDKEMCTVGTKVLINLAKYEKSSASVWQVPGNVTIILNLMSAWCGKNDPLFCNCCTLLWLFAQEPTNAVKIVKVPQVQQKLTHYYKQLKQKQDRTQALMKSLSKVKAKQPKFVLPSLKPDWSLTGACLQQTFENPLYAVSSVIEQLNMKPDVK